MSKLMVPAFNAVTRDHWIAWSTIFFFNNNHSQITLPEPTYSSLTTLFLSKILHLPRPQVQISHLSYHPHRCVSLEHRVLRGWLSYTLYRKEKHRVYREALEDRRRYHLQTGTVKCEYNIIYNTNRYCEFIGSELLEIAW